MNIILKYILIAASTLFLFFIVMMVRKRHLEHKYTLTWLIAAASFLIIAIFHGIVYSLASILSIKEPVNALFLIIFLFVLLILFTLTVTISKLTADQRKMAQEMALLTKRLEDISHEK